MQKEIMKNIQKGLKPVIAKRRGTVRKYALMTRIRQSRPNLPEWTQIMPTTFRGLSHDSRPKKKDHKKRRARKRRCCPATIHPCDTIARPSAPPQSTGFGSFRKKKSVETQVRTDQSCGLRRWSYQMWWKVGKDHQDPPLRDFDLSDGASVRSRGCGHGAAACRLAQVADWGTTIRKGPRA